MAQGQPLDPRLPDFTLRNWPERLTQRLAELFRSVAQQLNQRLAFGTRTIYVPASAMVARTTNGPASGSTELANKVMLATLDFDSATAEYAQFSVQMPESWDRGIVRAKFLWAHATVTASTSASAGVVWRLQAQAYRLAQYHIQHRGRCEQDWLVTVDAVRLRADGELHHRGLAGH
jgi:hypothetical protein